MPPMEMSGKVCMVTGANSGIGKEIALELARKGATIVMVCRDREKAEATRADIVNGSRCEEGKVELIIADLSSLKEVRSVAETFNKAHDRLHVLVSNAGTVPFARTLTVDGLETQFAVNHLAPFLLTHLLLDTLKASAPARIVITASGMHKTVSLDFDNLQGESKYKPMWQYAKTKLMNIMFCYEMARRLEGTGVTVTCWSPGFTNTGLGREFRAGSRFAMRLFGKSARKGALTGVFLATSPEVEGVTGKYFTNGKPVSSSDETHDAAERERLWKTSAEMAGLSS